MTKEIRLFALFKFDKSFKDPKSAKVQVMMHKHDFKDKKFIDLNPELISLGSGSFNVY